MEILNIEKKTTQKQLLKYISIPQLNIYLYYLIL